MQQDQVLRCALLSAVYSSLALQYLQFQYPWPRELHLLLSDNYLGSIIFLEQQYLYIYIERFHIR